MNSELDPKIRIRAPLRCDGVGSLDCAEDVESGMRMAVRWLPLEANGAAAARAVESLPVHPTLPKIRSTGRVGSAAFVAMDFPDGKLLATELGNGFSVERVRKIGEEIADALSTMHAQDVVHGELSADSILLCPDKSILWDMPLVLANRLTDRRGEERMLSQLPRIAPYLSPERARGVPALPSSDIYALGAILAQLLGAPAPKANSTLTLLNQLASGEWRPEVPADAPAALRTILGRMLMVDPRARPSAREVSERLKHALETPAITAPEMPAVVLPYAEIPVVRSVPAVADDVPLLPPPLPVKNAAQPKVDLEAVIATSTQLPVTSAPVAIEVKAESAAAQSVAVEAKANEVVAEVKAPVSESPAVEAKAEQPATDAVMPTPVDARREEAAVAPQLRTSIAPTNPEAVRAEEKPVAPAKSKLPWMALAGVSAAVVLTLSGLLYWNRTQQPKAMPAPVQQPVVAEVKAAPKPTDDDLLEPLVPADVQAKQQPAEVKAPVVIAKQEPVGKEPVQKLPPPVVSKHKASAKKSAHIAAAQPKADESEKADAVEDIKSTKLGDFDFLSKDNPKPTTELKRPEF